MALTYKEYNLSNSAIEEISEQVQNYLEDLGCERKQLHHIRLTVEELLLNIQEKSGARHLLSGWNDGSYVVIRRVWRRNIKNCGGAYGENDKRGSILSPDYKHFDERSLRWQSNCMRAVCSW